MRLLLALTGLLVCGASALCAPSPFPSPPLARVTGADAINLGPAGAMLEADYFNARQPNDEPFNAGRIFPCRIRLHTAAQARRAVQTCE